MRTTNQPCLNTGPESGNSGLGDATDDHAHRQELRDKPAETEFSKEAVSEVNAALQPVSGNMDEDASRTFRGDPKRALLWDCYDLKRGSKASKYLELAAETVVNFSIAAPHTFLDVVMRMAEASQIPVESLPEQLRDPVFTRGQVIYGFVGDQLDVTAANYSNMRWWVSERGINMDILSSTAALQPSRADLITERAARRRAIVMPILCEKGWAPGRLVTAAGVGKNSVYQYLNGTRAKITDDNRRAIAEALGLRPEDLPN